MPNYQPCKDCKDRKLSCHDHCPKYREFRRRLENRKQTDEDKRKEYEYIAYRKSAITRMKRNRN